MKRPLFFLLCSILALSPLYSQEEGDKNLYTVHSHTYRRAATARKHQYDRNKRNQYLQTVKEYRESMEAYQQALREYRNSETNEDREENKARAEKIVEKAKGLLERSKSLLADYLQDKIFLPTYDELASSRDGITLDDWKLYFLSEATFQRLNKNGDKFLSKEELDQHPLMGSTHKQVQDRDSIAAACKNIPDYQEKLKQLRKRYPQEVVYYTSPDYPSAEQVPTTTLVVWDKVKNKPVAKKLPLGEYTANLIAEVDSQSTGSSYLLGFLLVCLLAGGTILIPIFFK